MDRIAAERCQWMTSDVENEELFDGAVVGDANRIATRATLTQQATVDFILYATGFLLQLFDERVMCFKKLLGVAVDGAGLFHVRVGKRSGSTVLERGVRKSLDGI